MLASASMKLSKCTVDADRPMAVMSHHRLQHGRGPQQYKWAPWSRAAATGRVRCLIAAVVVEDYAVAHRWRAKLVAECSGSRIPRAVVQHEVVTTRSSRCRIIDRIGAIPMPPAMNRKRFARSARKIVAWRGAIERGAGLGLVDQADRGARPSASRWTAMTGAALAGSLHSEYLRVFPLGTRTPMCAPAVNGAAVRLPAPPARTGGSLRRSRTSPRRRGDSGSAAPATSTGGIEMTTILLGS